MIEEVTRNCVRIVRQLGLRMKEAITRSIYRVYISGLQPFSVCRPLSTWWARRHPPVFASLFLTRRFGLICMSHVIRLDAKQSAMGCATCTWLEGATTCGVIQCYPIWPVASRARAGPGAAQLMAPLTGLPLPPPTKNSNYFVCVFVEVKYSHNQIMPSVARPNF